MHEIPVEVLSSISISTLHDVDAGATVIELESIVRLACAKIMYISPHSLSKLRPGYYLFLNVIQ